MQSLNRRIESLEQGAGAEDLTVVIRKFGDRNPFAAASSYFSTLDGAEVIRKKGEGDDAFCGRADVSLRAGRRGLFVMVEG
jgi:hypothetical protein